MKKIFAIMVMMGIVIAMATAGGVDAEILSVNRIVIQGAIASALIFFGTYFAERGERA